MPFYNRLGDLPKLKHTTFYKSDGKSLYREELISTKGFSGIFANRYRHNMPTALVSNKELHLAPNIDWPEA